MPSRPGTVSDRRRRRKDQTGGERCGGAQSDGGSFSDESVRASGADGGNFCECPGVCQTENSANGLAVAGSRAIAAFSGACEGQAGVHGLSFWACTATRRRHRHGARLEKTPDGVEKSGSGFRGVETALAADWRTRVAGDSEVASAGWEVVRRFKPRGRRLDREFAQSEAMTENSGTCRGVRATTFSGFATAFTIKGMRRYSSKRCLPAARRAAVSILSARPGTRRTTASVDFSARNPAPVATPHLRSARAKRKTPARARTLFCCSADSFEKWPSLAR